MTKNNRSAFEQEFADVQPLNTKTKVTPSKPASSNTKQNARVNATSTVSVTHKQEAQPADLEFVDPHTHLEWKISGVQPETMNKLKSGQYRIQEKLDLHNIRVSSAFRKVSNFLSRCVEQRLRTVIIVHGLGLGGNPPAQMKSHVAHWLRQHPKVNAYVSAPGHQGGSGATLVHLKKSRDSKQETKERIASRLG